MLRNIAVSILTIGIAWGIAPLAVSAESDAFPAVEVREPRGEELPLDAWAMLPAITQASVSRDGRHIGILRAQNIGGDYVIEIRRTDDLSAEPVRLGAERMEIQNFFWLDDNERILVIFRQNIQAGNDNRWAIDLAVVNIDGTGDWETIRGRSLGGGTRRAETSQNSNMAPLDFLPDNPDEILLQYDINGNFIPDVVRYNLNTGRLTTVLRGNTRIFGGFGTDWDGDVRVAMGFEPAFNGFALYARLKGSDEWREFKRISPEVREHFDWLQFSVDDPNQLYVRTNNGNDKAGIYLFDLETEELSECLFCPQSVDADTALFSDKPESRGELIGFAYTGKHPVGHYLDGEEEALYNAVSELFPDRLVSMVSRSDDDNAIVIQTSGDNDPGTYYLLKDKRELDYIASASSIEEEHLSPVRYVKFTARDGMEIPAYVTIPRGDPPFPAVAMPHGGPWVRDVNIYDEWSQMLAHYGYAVIQPQYRGSDGFGLEHWKAGDKKWGLEMQDDVDDAALYLVDRGIADPDRLAIFGWSYGGYSAFVGSMREDNIYQCAIAGAGVSSLDKINAELSDNPFLRRLQRPTIQGVSPIEHVEDVNIPILVVHGEIDERVHPDYSRRFVRQLERYNKDHKYVEIEGLDHFYNTFYYHHKTEFYSELLNWLETKCG